MEKLSCALHAWLCWCMPPIIECSCGFHSSHAHLSDWPMAICCGDWWCATVWQCTIIFHGDGWYYPIRKSHRYWVPLKRWFLAFPLLQIGLIASPTSASHFSWCMACLDDSIQMAPKGWSSYENAEQILVKHNCLVAFRRFCCWFMVVHMYVNIEPSILRFMVTFFWHKKWAMCYFVFFFIMKIIAYSAVYFISLGSSNHIFCNPNLALS